ncbi:MAG: LOG family protein [Deltaproteobacteria bacterium]|nr:LOG family protein [Deltaproteobacteria bacterium]
MKIRTDIVIPVAHPTTSTAPVVKTTPVTTTTTTAPVIVADGKRFDAHTLAPPSSTVHQPQPGKRAELDLRTWQPSQLREAMLGDIQIVYDLLVKLPPAVTFFGGARIKEGDPYYAISQEIGALLASKGRSLRTGAGPGIMTAGPEGYKKALKDLPASMKATTTTTLDSSLALHPLVAGMTDAQKTQGFRIRLPFEQGWSDAIDVGAEAKLFPYRKLALYENCAGVAVFPGGYGTLDEMFEVMALGEGGRFHKPLAAVGVEFWQAILGPIEKAAVQGRKLIPQAEWDKLKVTDDPAALLQHFDDAAATTMAFERPPIDRAKKLAKEIEESINVLDRLPPAVTFLGGRRLDDNDPTLQVAQDLAKALAKEGIPLRVGSAGVVAAAVCDGAAAADKDTLVQGVLHGAKQNSLKGTRDLPNLQIHQSVDELITHKEIVGRRSQAFVALPGGLNTLGEVFSVLTQIQTGHLPKIPVVLVGKDYWGPIFQALRDKMLSPDRKTISPEDLDLVVITDDPAEALRVMQPALTSPTSQHVAVEGTASATLFEGDKATMLNPPGRTLAGWLDGKPNGGNVITKDIDHDVTLSRGFVEQELGALHKSVIDVLDQRGVDHRHVAWALDHGVGADVVAALVAGGAGPQAFRFLWSCAPMAAYQNIGAHALAIAARWTPHQEVVFQRFTELATSKHLQNPDALKSWLQGASAPGAPGDGYCTMLGDAWDLVSAGHKIAVEEHAQGLGDLIDLSERVVYQHKRVLSRHLAPALKKAAEQLKGFTSSTGDKIEGAPPGMKGVVHLDLRNNGHFNHLDDATIAARVATMSFPKDRVDVITLLLDDRVLQFDKDGKLLS